MTKSKSTKRALLASTMSLLLCFAMLIGTTFAWFTDSVSTGVNKIVAGNLKIELNYKNGDSWENAENVPLFNYDQWEPGYMAVQGLQVKNAGNLALKWKAAISSTNELTELAEVIDVYVKAGAAYSYVKPASREEVTANWTKVGTLEEFVNGIETTTYGSLKAEETADLGLALVMDTEAGNKYQGKDLGGNITLTILATQDTVESDSFDNQYDAEAEYDGWDGTFAAEQPENLEINTVMGQYSVDGSKSSITISNEKEFLYVMNNQDKIANDIVEEVNANDYHITTTTANLGSWTIKLDADLNFNNISMDSMPYGYGVFDGQGHTIENVNIVSDSSQVGLFKTICTVSNLNVKNIKVTSSANNAQVGTVAGFTNGIWTDVNVDGFAITAKGTGAYTGGLLGNCYGNKINCSVSNGTISGGKNVGGFAGFLVDESAGDTITTLCDCSVSNVVINASERASTIGSFAGRLSAVTDSHIILTNCTVENVTGKNVPTDRIYGDIPNKPVIINGVSTSN